MISKTRRSTPMAVLGAVALQLIFAPVPVAADQRTENLANCNNAKQQVSTADAISACTALINGGTETPSSLAGIYYHLADAFSDAYNFREAVANYSKAHEFNPNLLAARSDRAASYNEVGEHQKALTDADFVIQKNPKMAPAYNNRGVALYKMGRYELAIAALEKAISLNPKYGNPHRHMGNIHRARGDNERALEEYNEAIRLNPKNALAFLSRADLYRAMGDTVRAEKDRETALVARFNEFERIF